MNEEDRQGPDPALALTATAEPSDSDEDLAGYSTDLASLADALDQAGPAERSSDDLRPGPFADGFEIEGRIGAGGMGVVYLARDIRLNRRVAIKLHNVRAGDHGFDRLLREATAMARLSHPNVISVYEVGTASDRLFIVMEYMSGGTLRGWLRRESRSVGEILDLFTQAGEGLAAAHDAELVHRDFKPDNVFIAEDGRVCVADFGLARAVGDSQSSDPQPARRASLSDSLDSRLTATGAAVGTPAYMAPEQFAGREVDHRADQFSFCVALYEALFGHHPFGGSSVTELRERVLARDLRDVKPKRRVPAWLRRIAVRGLSPRPGDRFADMRALLAAIRRGRRRRKLVAASAIAACLAGALAGGTWALASSSEPELCTGLDRRLAGVWDRGVGDRVEDAFARGDAAFGPPAFDRVATVLDRYRADWISQRTETCRATRVTGDQSEALMDLRVACLERRRGELAALTALLADDPGPELIATSVEAAYALTDLDACRDADALRAAFPPPTDPDTVAAVARQRGELDQIEALRKLGQYERALAGAGALERAVRAIDYPPLRAEALLLIGQLRKKVAEPEAAEKTLHDAADAAAVARDDLRLARAWVELVRVVSHLGARYDEALALARVAETAIARAGGDPLLGAELAMHRGSIHLASDRPADAVADYEASLSVLRDQLGPGDPRLGVILYNLSLAHDELDDADRARALAEQSLELVSRGYGEAHPEVADALNLLAIDRAKAGELQQALPMFERAQRILENALGSRHPRVASAINNVGRVLRGLGRKREARARFERAHQVWRDALGPDHPNTVTPLHNLGALALDEARWADAERAFAESLRILEAAHGPASSKLIRPLEGLVRAASAGRDRAAVRQLCQRLATLAAAHGKPGEVIEVCPAR